MRLNCGVRSRCQALLLQKLLVLSSWLLSPSFAAQGDSHDTTELINPDTLSVLYEATGGDQWNENDGWKSNDNDVCYYHGVTCYPPDHEDQRRRGHVQVLDLSDNHLVGTLPSDVYKLPYIEKLIFRDNADLEISFDEIGEAQYLTDLIISNTIVRSFEGIQDAASSLETLHLTKLGVSGPFPNQILALTNLVGLFANYNQFSGSLPSEIGNLSRLQELFLYENELKGELPASIGNLINLRTLSIGQNAFSGQLPAELNRCTNLEILAAHRASGSEKGTGITGSLPSLSNLMHIGEIDLQNQKLTGPIPSDFLQSAPASDVIKVDLSNNEISGSIPAGLAGKKRMNLYLADNKIDSLSTSFCDMIPGWMGGSVGSIGCEALLCPEGTSSPVEGRNTGSQTCQQCSANRAFWGQTSCDGSADSSGNGSTPVNERAVLIELYNDMQGRYWTTSTNWLTFGTDVCEWHGIECNADGEVTSISLSNNGLTQAPPDDLFRLPVLTKLDLSSNSIKFPFSAVGVASNLEVLDLSQTDLPSLDGIEALKQTKLKDLSVAANYLQGNVPSAIFELSALEHLDISHNRFSGALPAEIGQSVNLVTLRCFGNQLSGQFPSQIGSLMNLEELHAAENSFDGVLPSELNNLEKLRVLSLHQTTTMTAIGGSLPSFTNLKQLESLQLDGNALQGSLPDDFLLNTMKGSSRVELLLSDNLLEGEIPTSWASRFENLFVDVTGNKITSIDTSICAKTQWMDGAVGSFGCDAIGCPQQTYNPFGRKTNSDSTCDSCASATYRGTKKCDSGEGAHNVAQEKEIDILRKLFSSTQGHNWGYKTGWTSSDNYCSWFGISCTAGGQVSSIDLESNGLTGSIPSSIFNLPSLTALNFGKNKITFSFDGIGNATRLVTLNLAETSLDSVAGIGGATSLEELHLTNNGMKGSVPAELFQLVELRRLLLNFNQFAGRIPADISSLVNLEELFLFQNRLTGQLPAAMGSLLNLKTLALSENNFDGTIPPEFDKLASLEILAIQREGGTDSSVTGNVGVNQGQSKDEGSGLTGPLPSFSGLKKLKQLYLGVNSLSGPIPSNFLDGIEDKSDPIEVDLISNKLTGELPPSLTRFDQMTIYVADNEISGIADALCRKGDWMSGGVASDHCDAILCPPDTFSKYGRQADSTSGCAPCPGGSTAPFFGSFDCGTSEDVKMDAERSILAELYDATQGNQWKHKKGWLDDDLPVCEWYGIGCSEGGNVESIRLLQNGLKGDLSTSLYGLPSLKELCFAGNEIRISFDGISEASKLEYLDLDSTGLVSLNGLSSAGGLRVLRLADNNFGGTFPTEILSLTGVQSLDLSGNNIGVSFPSSISGLSNLAHLICSRCSFEGSLPASIGDLQNLEELRLDQNFFSGLLPTSLASLSKLKNLDLSLQFPSTASVSQVGFGGDLAIFANFSDLTQLHLRDNSFEGAVPDSFLQRIDATETVTVDLRNNRISGALPLSLQRFQSLNLYLANNMIDSIPDALCQLPWNGRSPSSAADCDFILCGIDSISGLGRATADLTCVPCPNSRDSEYLGGTTCGTDLELEVLDQLYYDLGGQEWMLKEGWTPGSPVCSRHGVTCHTDSGLVKSLDLHENNLVGTVPEKIWMLTRMDELNLRQNDIDVSFATIADASALKSLQLSQTNVKSLVNISRASSLESLHVANNDIAGPLPAEIFNLTNLKNLYLNYNKFTGALPEEISQLRKLEELYLFNNELEGQLPAGLALLVYIRVLSLGENKFSGTVPFEISFLPFLEILSLQKEKNEFSTMFGVVDGFVGDLPTFHSNGRLRELYLGSNAFGGTIPSNFLSGIHNKSSTVVVDLSTNSIDGPIPASLADFSDLRLDVSNNRITEIPPEICGMDNWMNGLLKEGCDALLCPPGHFNEYGMRVASEECHQCDHRGVALYYGSTFCGAVLPGLGFDERAILEEFFTATDGLNWLDRANWMSQTSICTWKGVKCQTDTEGVESVVELSLPSNNLRGGVPSITFYMPSLKVLNVERNEVGINLRDLSFATALEELYMGSVGTIALKGIGGAPNLRVLKMDRNVLPNKELPEELFSLIGLKKLDISHCGFAGSLPSAIGKLVNLESFSSMNNNFEGELPDSMGEIAGLKTLLLSDNKFYGKLPESLTSLTGMETFALDKRARIGAGLSGPLPSFADMTNLKTLDLGANSFTGSIPSDFLENAAPQGGEILNVYLDSNILTGEVPSHLARFDRLNLDVAGNEIESIAQEVCAKTLWWDGDVGKFLDCEGLLCAPGKYSSIGRQSSEGARCEDCPDSTSTFLGQKSCPTLLKARAKEILQLLYTSTGGANWKKQDNWMSDTADICTWYGVECDEDDQIEKLVLGSNNLVGTPPKELFELPGLRHLWLYSNPIDFRFDGIELATTLTSLQLDSTGLKSLTGVGQAPALVDLDVRFNKLQGQLPAELDNLDSLETLFCGDNHLTGSLPHFSKNRRLSALRVGGNEFTGLLPSFAMHPQMKTLDVSYNQLSGPIPDDFFAASDPSTPIFIDLSSNQLSGVIPASLAKFDDATIYARNNQISGIHEDLCLKTRWNGNTVGSFGCDGILCPPGSYSPSGRASDDDPKCHPCSAVEFFGSTECSGHASSAISLKAASACLGGISGALASVLLQ